MSLQDRFALSMSPEDIRRRYAEERERRLRPDGIDQYVELDELGEVGPADPYAGESSPREPVTRTHEVLVVGGGFGGILQAVHLRRAGVDDVVLVEKAGDFGGTWYWNRYPGAACDVESYVYLPMLDDTGYVPTEKYARAPEIFAYARDLAGRHGLYERTLFGTQVTGAEWDEDASRWTVTTDAGDRLSVRHLIIAGGILHKAKLPGIPGLATFEGRTFHTSRWDYSYTGGGPTEFMDGLAETRVGIIGTGATAVQVIPRLAEAAASLHVFQRTPSAIGVRGNRPTDPDWAASLEPGWQHERLENVTAVHSGRHPEVDMVADGWSDIFSRDGSDRAQAPEELDLAAELADMERMEEIRARVDETVTDPATAAALKPWYGHMCKRPCFHDEYLPAFNRPTVTLVDTEGRGVDRVTPRGVVVGDQEYELDLLVFASGFEITTDYTRRMGFDPVGPGGLALSEAWAEGPETLHGTEVRRFPNLHVIGITQGGGAGVNFLQMIHAAAEHIAHIVGWAVEKGVVTVEPTKEATENWFHTVLGTLAARGRYHQTCTPGYYNNEGAGGDLKAARRAAYVGKPDEFLAILADWRRAERWDDLTVTYAS